MLLSAIDLQYLIYGDSAIRQNNLAPVTFYKFLAQCAISCNTHAGIRKSMSFKQPRASLQASESNRICYSWSQDLKISGIEISKSGLGNENKSSKNKSDLLYFYFTMYRS